MWLFNNKELKEDEIEDTAIGFIYLITNLESGYRYIGRKMLTKAGVKKAKTLKDGTKSKIKTKTARKESDWKNYYGSCKELLLDMEMIGKYKFKREILVFANSVATLNYLEAKYQFKFDVLEDNTFYNANIMIRAYKKNILNKF